ncbi:putative arginine--tRNA ligase, mitochondrial, partial [Araneus ventricosus]
MRKSVLYEPMCLSGIRASASVRRMIHVIVSCKYPSPRQTIDCSGVNMLRSLNIPPENVIVEYSSPNVAKPFHFGHFRSTIIGNYIANLCKYVGHKVTRLNYVGDWGLQYGILAVGFNKFGCEEMLQKDPLNHLFEVYKKANEDNENNTTFKEEAKMYFKKMEEGNPEILALWKKLRDLSLKEMEITYK